MLVPAEGVGVDAVELLRQFPFAGELGLAQGADRFHVGGSDLAPRRAGRPDLNAATLGAAQNRMDQVISNLQISVENQSAAKSRITDADFAQETANLSRANILQQAGNAMIAQANQIPSQVLSLLR